jgi:alpha,alpha-trehalase
VLNFVDTNFRGEGLELEAQALPNFNANPPFLNNVADPLLRAFAQIVHTYWTQLIRGTNSSTLCDGVTCESTLIPLNHTFVIPGGRFREQCRRFLHIRSVQALTVHLQTTGTASG